MLAPQRGSVGKNCRVDLHDVVLVFHVAGVYMLLLCSGSLHIVVPIFTHRGPKP